MRLRSRPQVEPLEARTVLSSGLSDQFVTRLYQDVLGREADAGGRAALTTLLNQSVPRGEVAELLLHSAEYRLRNVDTLYADLLHRPADPAGREALAHFLAAGGSLEQARVALTGSAEYLSVRGGGTRDGFLDALYQDALGRAPDAGGRTFFGQLLSSGATPGQVAALVFGSAEGRQRVVADLYQRYLHRPADAGGLALFTGLLHQGGPEEQVITSFLGSEEYVDFYQTFVVQAYQDLFGRDADAGGLAAGVAFQAQGGSHEQLARRLLRSAEYRLRTAGDLYATLLHRQADGAGRDLLANFLASGGTAEEARALLAGSAEYFQVRGNGTRDGFLDALYQDALGRTPDAGGRAAFLQQLAQGVPASAVAGQVFGSAEARHGVVQDLFQRFLNRAATAPELSRFAATLANGDGEDPVVAALLGLEEYCATGPGGFNYLTESDVLNPGEVDTLLKRAAAASASSDGIIAVVDRGGRILGVRVEAGVSPALTGSVEALTFAIDGALAKARTAAFFANNEAPLTSRTIQFISQSTITQREAESNPNIPDIHSTVRGPGFVGPVGLGGHFPPGVPNTPAVDLFGIEHTNRDGTIHPGADRVRGTADDQVLPNRFNVPDQFIPDTIPLADRLTPPDSYGFASGRMPNAQARGIGTLPGGIPIYKNGNLVGGIGVFFPGTTGYATEENSSLSVIRNVNLPDRSFEAEWVAFAAVGGSAQAGAAVGALAGVAPVAGTGLPFGRIDLVGVTLDVFGPGGDRGVQALTSLGRGLGIGDPDSGVNVPVDPGPDRVAGTADDLTLKFGARVPEGWLVAPHDGVGITAQEVERIIAQGVAQADRTRAQIRLPAGVRSKMVLAVSDSTGAVLGLFRMKDATVFSIDVAVAKSRNVAYFDDPAQVLARDLPSGLPAGASLTNRTFRYLAQPRYPVGIDGAPPGDFSILNDGGTGLLTALEVGPRLPASAFQSVFGFDSFNPGTNFRARTDPRNQNGIVFFPGSEGVYKAGAIVGGLGVSGDGVDQDDVVTSEASVGFKPPGHLRADMFFVDGVRLPYQKFPRNPEGE